MDFVITAILLFVLLSLVRGLDPGMGKG